MSEEIKNENIIETEKIKLSNNNEKDKLLKPRNSSIDFIRIISMYAIVVHHILITGRVLNKYERYKELRLINILCHWHVNCFALISGIVSSKNFKYSNLIYLWFYTFFYSLSIYLISNLIYQKSFIKEMIPNIFPVIFYKYWYFSEYFGMYLFLPIINKGLSILNKNELKLFIYTTLSIFIILKDLMNNEFDTFKMSSGYSILWLMNYYIVGVYLRKYIIEVKRNKVIFCIKCIFIYFTSSLLCYYSTIYDGKYKNFIIIRIIKHLFVYRINSLAMISQSISITLFFSQIKFNKIISKLINNIAKLTFGVYLIHMHGSIRFKLMKMSIKNYSINLSLKSILFLLIINAFIIFIICIIIDCLRNLIFRFFKIRLLCILPYSTLYLFCNLFAF